MTVMQSFPMHARYELEAVDATSRSPGELDGKPERCMTEFLLALDGISTGGPVSVTLAQRNWPALLMCHQPAQLALGVFEQRARDVVRDLVESAGERKGGRVVRGDYRAVVASAREPFGDADAERDRDR